MSLRFRVELTKGTPRISVLRVISSEKGQEKLEPLGSFGQRKSPDLMRDKLNQEELYEFDNFLSALEFSNEFFKSEADELDRFIIKVAPSFQKALFELWKEASKYDLEFIPEKEMLYGVLNKAKEIEQKINKLSGKQVDVLESLGINIHEESSSLSSDKESKKLFQALLDLNEPEKICQEFQEISQNTYHKNTRFETHFFKVYADPENKKNFPKWYYTIAIDVLQQHGINPLTIIAPHKVAKHWARLRVDKMTLDKAKQQFISLFKPAKKYEKKCLEMINIIYLEKI